MLEYIIGIAGPYQKTKNNANTYKKTHMDLMPGHYVQCVLHGNGATDHYMKSNQ